MSLLRKFLFLALAAGGAWLRAEDLAARVILLANRADPDSVRLARYYAQQRAVPVENIFAFAMPLTETITWPEFVASVWQPLQDELIRRQWIDAIPMALSDAAGRRKGAVNGHRISYLVVCRGVPLRISHDPALYQEVPPLTANPELRTNQAAVDSELALLAQSSPPINAFVPNPLFRNDHPGTLENAQVVKVARLDGPDYESARALVDHALAAERTGLLGRAYVDLGGIHPEGDRWLEAVATQLADLGFDLDVDRSPATLPATARIDAPVLYFGWYAADLNGPFALPGFQFPPGAIALHIHSFSAHTLRSATEGWCGPLVARGVTATFGNVFEPYLQFTHQPDLLLRALARGDTLGDAACYALPVLSWQAVMIGDPLYRPFALSVDAQLKLSGQLPPSLAGYAVLRKENLLEAAGQTDAGRALLRGELRARPNLALGVALAARLERAGDPAGAARALAFADSFGILRTDEWALARLAAQRLAADGAPNKAFLVYQHLLSLPALPRELRVPWLREAQRAAVAADNPAQAKAWEQELEGLIAPLPAVER